MDTRRRRILFRASHRGTFENDIILGGYARRHLERMSEAELDALETLMEHEDSDLADWLTGRLPVPEAADTPMFRALRAFALSDESRAPENRPAETPAPGNRS